jgi:hypothetical protein
MHPAVKQLIWKHAPTSLLARYFRQTWSRPVPDAWPEPQTLADDQGCLAGRDLRVYSQNGEDGIIRFITQRIASPEKTFVEFGFGLRENNCLRLALQEGYSGLYMDGFSPAVRVFNECARQQGLRGVRAAVEYLTVDNIDAVLAKHGFNREVDVFSIDVDGVDYWLWEASTVINPRLMIIEYNASFGPDASVTVPYEPSFDRTTKGADGHYHGASITALAKLGTRKGYALLGCDAFGANAFFLRRDLLDETLYESSPKKAHRWSGHVAAEGSNSLEIRDTLLSMPIINV